MLNFDTIGQYFEYITLKEVICINIFYQLLNKIKHPFTKSLSNTIDDNLVNIMTEEFTTESPTVSMEVLFPIPKEFLKSPNKELTPQLCCSYIYDFQVLDSLDKYYTPIDNPCGKDLPQIIGTYYLYNKYVSCSVSYNASLLQNSDVFALERNFYTVLPFLYCGSQYIKYPIEDDFVVNLNVLENPVSPIGETEEYYFYQITVESNISLITVVIVDESDVNTLRQLNSILSKPSDNNSFTLKELSSITDLSYDFVDISSIYLDIFRYLPNLRNLTMTNCQIDSIFPQMFSLDNLENLNLSSNNLKSLPAEIVGLPHLQFINLNNNKLADLSVFENTSIAVMAQSQEVHIDMLDKNSISNRYELDSSFLRDCDDNVCDIESTTGSIAGGIISWNSTEGGKTVDFQFTNHDNFFGSVFVYLKNYNYTITDEGVITSYTPQDSSVTNVSIPKSINGIEVKAIGNSAFYWCSSLTSIIIPDSVTSIWDSAFYHCHSLSSIIIPDSVTSIGNVAFFYCSSLSSIIIPHSITSIRDYTFANCSSLNSIIIPNNLTSIGDSAFYGCSSLDSIIIPDNLTSIGYRAFYLCSNLTSIIIPDSVTYIGELAFSHCNILRSITISCKLCGSPSNRFDTYATRTLTITASSEDIDPNSDFDILLNFWTNCANNLNLNTFYITGKYLVIDGETKNLNS